MQDVFGALFLCKYCSPSEAIVCVVLDSLRLSSKDADGWGQRKERGREGEIVFISLTLFLGIASLFLP